eukprot:TRINITY_DN6549_c0_g1_i1.p2 TRINITY_DN6549_c0_g1~~TRINITY_DN6549_c0_g1_i1.p2  ORF type:complete len:276 (+),score=106.84 TRINITY_DN6549_c0_g1_i1:52-879(+)
MSCCPPGSHGYLEPQGEGKGKKTTAGDIEVYETGEMGKAMLLIMPDVWGWHSGRIRSIADDFAAKGFFVVIPKVLDQFEGGTDDDALPPDFKLFERFPALFELFKGGWHNDAIVPKLVKVLEHYAKNGVEKVGFYGFCYGGWIGFHLASEKRCIPIVCCASSHPSIHIESGLGKDPVELAKKQTCPWLFQPTGVVGGEGADPDIYDADGSLMKELEELFPGKNQSTRYSEEQHGFVTRGSITTGWATTDTANTKANIVKAVEEVANFMEKYGAKL